MTYTRYTIHYLKDSKNKYYFLVKQGKDILFTSRKSVRDTAMMYDAETVIAVFIGNFKIINEIDPVPAAGRKKR